MPTFHLYKSKFYPSLKTSSSLPFSMTLYGPYPQPLSYICMYVYIYVIKQQCIDVTHS